MPPTTEAIKVLFIGSDETEAVTIREYLEQPGKTLFAVDWTTTYEDGQEALAKCCHDVYLIDFHLGQDQSGLDFLRYADQQSCEVPVLVLSEHSEQDLDLQALEAGAADYLIKSLLTPALLRRSVRYAIERRKNETALKQIQVELESNITERTAELSKTNRILQEKLVELEELKRKIQESLKRRTDQVEISTQIAQKISSVPAPEALFQLVVNLVQERFGYYHVHIYLLQEDHLVMREGTGDAARKMKDFEHKIPYHAARSLVARAARTGEPVLVADVAQDRRWLPNLLLAETKSELAVPIKLGDQVLGVLDIQNDTVGGLDTEDQILMMGLCGQIAVAINNQHLELERKQSLEAQQRLIDELDAFGHTVGHNLKDPVGLIIGYTALLKEKVPLPEEYAGYLNAILKNSQRLNNIIEELQLLSSIRQEEVPLVPLNMLRIIAEVQQRLAYIIKEYRAKIVISGYWPAALGYPPWVEEVWATYISNAIRYGGSPPIVHVGATAQSGGMVRFWVRDNGPGLSVEEQKELFAEFTQLNQASLHGHGLGLSIAQRIVHRLGGQVGVSSEGLPGKGCIFSFTLPEAGEQK